MHMETLSSLNKAQLQILKLLSNIKTEEETKELSQVISNFYAKKATEEMDRLWESGQWNEEENDQILKEHLRTPYNKNGNA